MDTPGTIRGMRQSSKKFIRARVLAVLFSTLGIMRGLHAEETVCDATDKAQISALFDTWSAALVSGRPSAVVDLYAPRSVLLPTFSNEPRLTRSEKLDYFAGFMKKNPVPHIDASWIDIGCNTATDAGLYSFILPGGEVVKARYTFTYRREGGRWLITSHHSSRMPE